MNNDFLASVAKRRSYYGIKDESPISDERLKALIEEAVKHTPSAMNSQSTRVVVLTKNQHDKLWDLTKDALRKIVPSEQFQATSDKIDSFKNGYGTVLFYEDMEVITSLQKQFELYKDNFPVWSHQASGISQFIVWNTLETEGFGASLQHYTELIEEDVKKEWQIPSSWKLIAQMPFGTPMSEPSAKAFLPLEDRVKFF